MIMSEYEIPKSLQLRSPVKAPSSTSLTENNNFENWKRPADAIDESQDHGCGLLDQSSSDENFNIDAAAGQIIDRIIDEFNQTANLLDEEVNVCVSPLNLDSTVDVVTTNIIDEVLQDLVEGYMVENVTPVKMEKNDVGNFSKMMAYRAIRMGSDEGFTPDKMNGVAKDNVEILLESPLVTPRPARRETLGSLSDCFKSIKLEDDHLKTFGEIPLSNAALSSNKAAAAMVFEDKSGSISTPSDLPRIKATSPPPPTKMEYSPTMTDVEVPKRSLFDSPIVKFSKDLHSENDIFLDNDCEGRSLNLYPEANVKKDADQNLCNDPNSQIANHLEELEDFVNNIDDDSEVKESIEEKDLNNENVAEKEVIENVEDIGNVDNDEVVNDYVEKDVTNENCYEKKECNKNIQESCIERLPFDQDAHEERVDIDATRNLPDACNQESFTIEEIIPKTVNEVMSTPNLFPVAINVSASLNTSCSFSFEDNNSRIETEDSSKTQKKKLMSRHSSLKSLKPQGQGQDTTPKSVKFCEAPPLKISPKPFVETQNEDDIDFLLKKIKSMKKNPEIEANEEIFHCTEDASFALPSKLDLPNLSHDFSSDKPVELTSITELEPVEGQDNDRSVLASHGGDFTLTTSLDDFQISRRDTSNVEPAMTVLQYQAILLEKDREIATLGDEFINKEMECAELMQTIRFVDENNDAMKVVVVECEKTIAQLGDERQKDLQKLNDKKTKVTKEAEQANEDLQAVERALKDTLKRYERTKEHIGQMKDHENQQKEVVKSMQSKLRNEQERYEILKTDANEKLSNANEKLNEIQKSKAAEILKLNAMLKKAELEVASKERQVDKLNQDNAELTQICDTLIAKCV